MVNEATVGYAYDPVRFFDELNTDMYSGSLANQQGFAIQFPTIGREPARRPSAQPAPAVAQRHRARYPRHA